jgi:hypothetical protein
VVDFIPRESKGAGRRSACRRTSTLKIHGIRS